MGLFSASFLSFFVPKTDLECLDYPVGSFGPQSVGQKSTIVIAFFPAFFPLIEPSTF
jgi:hypothetical protein